MLVSRGPLRTSALPACADYSVHSSLGGTRQLRRCSKPSQSGSRPLTIQCRDEGRKFERVREEELKRIKKPLVEKEAIKSTPSSVGFEDGGGAINGVNGRILKPSSITIPVGDREVNAKFVLYQSAMDSCMKLFATFVDDLFKKLQVLITSESNLGSRDCCTSSSSFWEELIIFSVVGGFMNSFPMNLCRLQSRLVSSDGLQMGLWRWQMEKLCVMNALSWLFGKRSIFE